MNNAKTNSFSLQETLYYLIEIRQRLLKCLLVTGITLLVFSYFANNIYHFFTLPLLNHVTNNHGLIATAVPAPFFVPFKSALMASIFTTVPFWLYQFWKFVTPALYQKEKKLLWMILFTSALLFYLGILFAYDLVLPWMFHFFISIAPAGVEVKPDIGQYFSFVMTFFIAFGLTFETPIIIFLLVWFGICSLETLSKARPYIIVGAFIAGMLLTPPDVVSQTLLALPLWFLYELGLILLKLARYFKLLPG